MTRILLLSHTTGYQLRAFNEAAERAGVELLFATDRCHRLDDPWQDRAVPVRFHDVSASVAAIADALCTRPVDGLIAVGDRPVGLAAHAAHALGLPWHSPEGAVASTDKRRSRTTLAAAGLPSPAFAVRDAGSTAPLAGLRFPVVLKPLGLSGSRGVIRANDDREFDSAAARIRRLLARPQIRAARSALEDQILVEEYIDGRELAIEGVMTRGALTTFAIFDKPDPLEGPFFEETIYVTPSRLPEAAQRAIHETVARAAHGLGLSHGPIHAECRVTADGRIYVLEIAGRPIGGLCGRVLAFAARDAAGRASLEDVLLEHARGRPIDGWIREPGGAAVMMVPIPAAGRLKGVSGQQDARSVPGVFDLRMTAKPDQFVEPLPEAGSYLGFIFARADDARRAESAVREAHRRLHFDIIPEIPIDVR